MVVNIAKLFAQLAMRHHLSARLTIQQKTAPGKI
jgi:hypothetical protein